MILECRLTAYLHLDPVRVRRLPLPLAQLWCNYAAQADGMETWWQEAPAAGAVVEDLDAHIATLRAAARVQIMGL